MLAALLVTEPDVRGVELSRSESVVIRTRNPARFFGRLGDLVAQHAIDVTKLETLDGGADAVFNYLQQGTK